MAIKTNLSHADRRLLNEMLDALGLTQKEMASRADVSQPWLSQALKGKRTSVDGEMLGRVANVLVEILGKRRPDGRFTKERTDAALNFLNGLVSGSAIPKLYRPGGPVPVDASHYVRRGTDNYALEAFQQMPFTMLVRGPVQCGKSSLLKRLEHKAQEIAIESVSFDPQQVNQQADFDTAAVQELYKSIKSKWGLEPFSTHGGVPNNTYDLLNWLVRVLPPPNKPRLLILDDLVGLGTEATDRWISNFVRGLDGLRETLQISVAVGLTYQFDAAFQQMLIRISSIVHWAPLVDVGWLSRERVDELVRTAAEGSSEIGDLFELLAGQPYLTHVAAVDADFREALREWIRDKDSEKSASTVRGHRAYRMHLRAIQSAILGPTSIPSRAAKALLRDFNGRLLGEPLGNPEHGSFFELAKLIESSGEPTLGIYKLIAEQLKDELRSYVT
jgi:transcriptional regulator with XRE-family HTH domain